MTFSFNLIDQPWIPVVRSNGSPDEAGLRDLLREAPNLRAIACETPLMNAAILPVVLALLHRVFGPKDRAAWKTLWNTGAFPQEALDAYFANWYERFDLFHPERPFYQARDERVKPKSVIHLVHSIGNTGTLFTHANDDEGLTLTAAEAARHLIAAQAFRTAGLSGLKEKFTDSPLTRGVLFWAYGDTLFETLMLNLLPYPGSLNPIPHTDEDRPSWEAENAFHQRKHPKGYLDYLTWPSNRILLLPVETEGEVLVEMMTVAPGLSLSADVISPQKRYSRKSQKDDWQFLYFNSTKSLWRDYYSLLALDDGNVRPPTVVEWLSSLVLSGAIDEKRSLQVTASGMLADQAKPIFYRQEQMPLPPVVLRDADAAYRVSQAIQQAEEAAKILREALNVLAEYVLMRGGERQPDKGDRRNLVDQWGSVSLYWERLEPAFWEFLQALSQGNEDAPDWWRDVLQQVTREALADAAHSSGTSAPALKGQVLAERRLRSKFKKLLES